MINEKQLQAACVMEFSQLWPEKEGQLFAVRNTTFSGRDGATQKAMGMKAGVSDLIFFEGSLVAIEIKFPGRRHEKDHVTKQAAWGEVIEKNGGEYFIVTSVSGFISVIEGGAIDPDVYTLKMIKEKINGERSGIVF